MGLLKGQLAPPNSDYAGFKPDLWALEPWLRLALRCHVWWKTVDVLSEAALSHLQRCDANMV